MRKKDEQMTRTKISCFSDARNSFGNKSLTEVITHSTVTNCGQKERSKLYDFFFFFRSEQTNTIEQEQKPYPTLAVSRKKKKKKVTPCLVTLL